MTYVIQIIIAIIASAIAAATAGLISYRKAVTAAKVQVDLQEENIFRRELIGRVEFLEDIATSYWLSAGRDKIGEALIKSRFDKLQIIILNFIDESHHDKFMNHLVAFHERTTGGAFESENRLEEPGTAEQIRGCAGELCKAIQNYSKTGK